jgi:hypothetical protein
MVALRRRDVADLNARARERMHAAGRLTDEVEIGERSYAVGDRTVLGRNDRHLDVLNGDRGEITATHENHVDVKLDRGPEVRLPGHYVEEHLDYGYAMTAHRVQGATVDKTFVLGSDEASREWGYTALSRHRDSATFYLNAPEPYLNREAIDLTDRDELVDVIEHTLDDSHQQQLAIEAIERDPAALRALRELEAAQTREREHDERLEALRAEREQTPWYRRAERHDLDQAIEATQRAAFGWAETADELVDTFEHRVSHPLEDGPPEYAQDPILEPPEIEEIELIPQPALEPPEIDLDVDLDFDLGP